MEFYSLHMFTKFHPNRCSHFHEKCIDKQQTDFNEDGLHITLKIEKLETTILTKIWSDLRVIKETSI